VGANCCEFVEKITPIINLMCGASDNQATKTKCMEQLLTQVKNRKQRERKKKRTQKNLFTQFSPN